MESFILNSTSLNRCYILQLIVITYFIIFSSTYIQHWVWVDRQTEVQANNISLYSIITKAFWYNKRYKFSLDTLLPVFLQLIFRWTQLIPHLMRVTTSCENPRLKYNKFKAADALCLRNRIRAIHSSSGSSSSCRRFSLLSWAQKPRTSISMLATVPPCLQPNRSANVILRGSPGLTISQISSRTSSMQSS